MYFAEELLCTREYPQSIKVNDRATALNLMVGLNGYTLCSGIISSELNGGAYVAVPFHDDSVKEGDVMDIGYIVRKSAVLTPLAQSYIREMGKYLGAEEI